MMQKTTGVGFGVTPDDLIGRERMEGGRESMGRKRACTCSDLWLNQKRG
jgi:hypothetical protein